MIARLPLVALPVLLAASGCGDSGAEEGAGAGGQNANVTFHRDVEPLLQEHCLSCHREGQIGGFSLESYEQASPMASLIAAYTAARLMPPFLAQETEGCSPRFGWHNDARLSDEQIATFSAWNEAGAPRGNPADAPPPYVPSIPGLPGADIELQAKTPTIVNGSEDVFTCVVYDPALSGPTWFDGLHFVADNRLIDHHAVIGRLPRSELPAGALEAGSYECFGSPGKMLMGWAPGGTPLELPSGAAFTLDQGEVLVAQMHYHPNGTQQSDQSKLQLRSYPAEPSYEYRSFLWGNARNAAQGLAPGPGDTGVPEFLIPPNAKDHTETMSLTLPSALQIEIPVLGVASHMHYIGVDMKIEVDRANPTATQPADECLLETPHWDFGWQRMYLYDTPFEQLPTITGGDTITLSCRYDNTLQNPGVQKALADQGMTMPVEIPLGESTLNEMCIGAFGILVPVGTPQF